MSNRVYESFLKTGLPARSDGKSFSPTAYNCYRTICYRFNPKTGTAYPGEAELIRVTGVSRQSVNRAITELKSDGIIDQPKKGFRNQRAEFRPVYHLSMLQESVNPALHINQDKETVFPLESDAPVIGKSKATNRKETGSLVSISTISTSKYDKYKIDELRFSKLLSYIPENFRIYIKPGKNYEKLLDELEHKETSLEAVGAFLAKQNWHTAGSKGGLLTHFLQQLTGEKRAGESSSMPAWCGGNYCDKRTRLWPEASLGRNGKLTHECPKCHPNQVEGKTNNLNYAPEIDSAIATLAENWNAIGIRDLLN